MQLQERSVPNIYQKMSLGSGRALSTHELLPLI